MLLNLVPLLTKKDVSIEDVMSKMLPLLEKKLGFEIENVYLSVNKKTKAVKITINGISFDSLCKLVEFLEENNTKEDVGSFLEVFQHENRNVYKLM